MRKMISEFYSDDMSKSAVIYFNPVNGYEVDYCVDRKVVKTTACYHHKQQLVEDMVEDWINGEHNE